MQQVNRICEFDAIALQKSINMFLSSNEGHIKVIDIHFKQRLTINSNEAYYSCWIRFEIDEAHVRYLIC